MNRKVKGYILGIIAAVTYGTNPLFALPLYDAGMDADSVLFFRYLFALPIIALMIKARGRSFKVTRKELLHLIVFGILMSLSSLTLFQSYTYMDAGIASTLLFVYPIMVALLMAVFFREKLTAATVFCIALALGGIGLLYRSSDGSTLNLTGVALVMASALSYAIYIVGINRKALKSVATLTLTFYVLLSGMSLFAVRTGINGLSTPDRWYLWGNLIALAVFPTAISFICTTRAIQNIGSTPTAILAGNSRVHWSYRIRGVPDIQDSMRNTDDCVRSGDNHYRRQHRHCPAALQEAVPETEKEMNPQSYFLTTLMESR